MSSSLLARESKIPPFQNRTSQRIAMIGFLVSTVLLTLCSPGVAIEKTSPGCDDESGHKGCQENFPTIRVALNSNVSLRCPNMTAPEMTFHLIMGKTQVAHYRIVQENITGERVLLVQDMVALRVNEQHRTVSFSISGVQKEHTGLYTCEAWISYPPPSTKALDAPKTLMLVEENRCVEKSATSEKCPDPVPDPQVSWSEKWWILGVLLAISTTFGVVVTVICYIIWVKLKGVELSQNDYINMHVPMCQKRKGVLHPLPRWF